MSCWVAPKIAAEIWGTSLADILGMVASGRLTACASGGFQFVRLGRFSLHGHNLPPEKRPPTFHPIENVAGSGKTPAEQVVTPEERVALSGDQSDESEMGPPPDEDPNDNRISGWREGRRRAGAMRRGPV